jgi:hypothetical protein
MKQPKGERTAEDSDIKRMSALRNSEAEKTECSAADLSLKRTCRAKSQWCEVVSLAVLAPGVSAGLEREGARKTHPFSGWTSPDAKNSIELT